MASLDIAEKRLPQDGRISLMVGDRPIDVRVSTQYGERIVLRLLGKQGARLDFTGLGMPEDTLCVGWTVEVRNKNPFLPVPDSKCSIVGW